MLFWSSKSIQTIVLDFFSFLLHLEDILYPTVLLDSTVMVSWALFILGPLSIHILTQACRGEELSREVVLSWFRERVLEELELEEPPMTTLQGPDSDTAQPHARHAPRRASRTSKTAWVNHGTSLNQEMSQIILFPSSGEKLCCFCFFFYLINTLNSLLLTYLYSFSPKRYTFILDPGKVCSCPMI